MFLLVFIASSQVFAGNDPLGLNMTGQIVDTSITKGKVVESFSPLPERVTPGQIIQYDIVSKNNSKRPLHKVEPEGKIPPGTEYIKNSAKSTGNVKIKFSADNGKSFSTPPLKLKTVLPDGTKIEKIIPPSKYTNIRFVTKSLKPGESFTSAYRVIVK
ncbi:MAG: DUF11 domain-containing protein [Deltaproteobacteria bacterium]|nr:DUF11 domain-containing protein [Deltaproteobacteria bacterium]